MSPVLVILVAKARALYIISEINAKIPVINVSTTAGIIDAVKVLKDSVKSQHQPILHKGSYQPKTSQNLLSNWL
jgi:hypothetical protein